jgi:hypothetical protein
MWVVVKGDEKESSRRDEDRESRSRDIKIPLG